MKNQNIMTSTTPLERRAILTLSGLFSLRMLGLFMILPVFSLYANQLTGVTPTLVGLTLGIYGLAQAFFQIPFGYASDRFGRKPIIILGLLLFALGSGVAALSTSIYGTILGRFLQGAGAIGSVIMALLSDLTRKEVRMRAMAFIGISIGLSFALAFVLGPLLNTWIGVRGIFWATALLSLGALFILGVAVPSPPPQKESDSVLPVLRLIPSVLKNPKLSALNFGIWALHASLVALFIKLPQAIQAIGYAEGRAWRFYLPVLTAALGLSIPGLIWMEKHYFAKGRLEIWIALLACSEVGIFYFFDHALGLRIAVCLFFTAFNILEASLPSWVAQSAPSQGKGTALGIFSSMQFLGIFVGGLVGGFLDQKADGLGVLLFCSILAIIWFSAHFAVNFKRGLE